ncbi:MAG: alkaline phosphatase family protein [Terriglobia bacterium]|nr:alkaline phosphatase family protein [Terriglobia bacterium]
MRTLRLCLAIALLAVLTACGGNTTTSNNSGGGNTGGNGGGTNTPPGNGSITEIKHIVWMLQENRSFDNYFGKLNDYRQAHGLGADVDGIPADASNPSYDGTTQVQPYHFNTVCVESLTPAWNASRRDVNRYNPLSKTGPMDGFVYSAANYAIDQNQAGYSYSDTAGLRAIGYYTNRELPYYYFMATQFATSDRWFSPILSRTPANRIANLAGSALGVVNDVPSGMTFSEPTIFSLLQDAGKSWKIYETSGNTYLGFFSPFYGEHKDHIASIDQYYTDVANNSLPDVAFIETGVETNDTGGTSSLDEHPNSNIQKGAAYVAKIINSLMNSSSWSSSAFILTYDEGGGNYDHVPPQSAVNPDSIRPMLSPTDDVDDYSRTGFRVPLIVVSPFAKKGYVSHTVMDYTAILKFIEKRFNLPNLTARDAAQPDMSEFFDFTNLPNQSAPTPPAQPTDAPCTFHSLP